jgi:hypothetical protein
MVAILGITQSSSKSGKEVTILMTILFAPSFLAIAIMLVLQIFDARKGTEF